MLRVNWDHTFGPNTVNHLAFGFQDDKAYGGGIDGKFADKLPQISGVASHDYPPVIRFNDHNTGDAVFEQYGVGAGDANLQPWLAPAWIVNDALSMTRGKHTISFGGEMRFAQNSTTFLGGQSGNFNFSAQSNQPQRGGRQPNRQLPAGAGGFCLGNVLHLNQDRCSHQRLHVVCRATPGGSHQN